MQWLKCGLSCNRAHGARYDLRPAEVPFRDVVRSLPKQIQAGTQRSTHDIQQPRLRNGIRVQHQRYSCPFGINEGRFLPVTPGGITDDAEQDGAENVRRAGKRQAE